MSRDYQHYVQEGRKLVLIMETSQCVIAYYACQVASIKHGGKSKTPIYTLKQYAADIGIHRKTLSEWTLIYRYVIEQLNIDPSKVTGEEWKVATRVCQILRAEKKARQKEMGLERKKGRAWDIRVEIPKQRIRDLFKQNLKGRCKEAEIAGWTDTLIGMKGKLRRGNYSGVNPVTLRALQMALRETSTELVEHMLHKNDLAAIQEEAHVAL